MCNTVCFLLNKMFYIKNNANYGILAVIKFSIINLSWITKVNYDQVGQKSTEYEL